MDEKQDSQFMTQKTVDGFLSRLFLISRMLNEQKKTFTDQAVKHGCIGCMFKDR